MKVAIVGSCPSSRLLAPYNDPSWLIWACSPDNVDQLPRIDSWFELHGDLGWQDAPAWEASYLNWLNDPAKGFNLYINSECVSLFKRDVIIFPATRLVSKFGPYWFTSSMAWMIAYAIDEGAQEIGIYGCDLAAKTEYYSQKPAITRWRELAELNGIKVTIPKESDLNQPPPLYGYSCTTPMGKKLTVRERELKNRVLMAQAKKTQMMREMDQEIFHLQGCLDQVDYTLQTWNEYPLSKLKE